MKVAIIGSFVVDLMARAPHLPEVGETLKGSLFKSGPGGKGSNQAIAAHRAGCDMFFSTKIGDDTFGEIAHSVFAEDRISKKYLFVEKNSSTGIALISVDENTSQNQIIVVPGACETFNDNDIMKLSEALDGCAYLLMQLEINIDALEKLIDIAFSKGIKVILNTAPVQSLPQNLYKKIFMVTPNEVEAKVLTGIPCDNTDNYTKIAKSFFDMGIKIVILTLGKQGVYVNDGEKETFINNYDVKVLDTTGAGDAFNGGLVAGLSMGLSIADAAMYGNIIANLSVTKMGTAPSMPYPAEIESFIKENDINLSINIKRN